MATIKQILDAANADIKTIMAHAGNRYLRNLLEVAYLPQKKMNLPEGYPPYKENSMGDAQLEGAFWQIAKKIDMFCRTDVKQIKLEVPFINALESLTKEDAQILMEIKDQNLDKLYPNVTLSELQKVGYFK